MEDNIRIKDFNNIERYYNENNESGVLYSPGFGAGWSTENYKALAIDKRIIEYWINEDPSKEDMEKFLNKLGYEYVLMDGYDNLHLMWIPRGTLFYIDNYDGSEGIYTDIFKA